MPGGGEEVETNDNKNASPRKNKTNFQLAIYTKKNSMIIQNKHSSLNVKKTILFETKCNSYYIFNVGLIWGRAKERLMRIFDWMLWLVWKKNKEPLVGWNTTMEH